MKKHLLLLVAILASLPIMAEQNLILLRHAEKQQISPDPALTTAGYQRASCFTSWLLKQDFVEDIKAVYSSNYRRTLTTAAIIAAKLELPVRLYRPRKLEEITEQLNHSGSSVVVVGHSNTTPILAGILAQQKIPSMDASNYDSFWRLQKIEGYFSASKLDMQQLGCNQSSD